MIEPATKMPVIRRTEPSVGSDRVCPYVSSVYWASSRSSVAFVKLSRMAWIVGQR